MRLLLPAVLLLAACGTDPTLFATPEVAPSQRIGIAFGTVEVRDVTLPLYAENEEIVVEGAGGALTPLKGASWADDPSRAVTLELSEALASLTGARVAAEPWPYDSFPAAFVAVRVSRFAAGADGQFRISGQWHAGGRDGERERSGRFAVAASYDLDGGASAIAAARGRAVNDLAAEIARQGL